MIRRLQGKQPRLGCAIARKTFIAIEMVRSDVEQYRHVGVEAVGEIDLVARQFQHIDATCGQWVLRQYGQRSEEHTSELQSLMRISYAVFCLKKKNNTNCNIITTNLKTSLNYTRHTTQTTQRQH